MLSFLSGPSSAYENFAACAKNLVPHGYVGIVDMYNSGAAIAQRLRDRGYEPVHVFSQPEPLACYRHSLPTPRPDRFGRLQPWPEIFHAGNKLATLEELRPWRVKAVIAGSEPGVELADWLSENLGLATNGTGRSRARRDKFKMQEALVGLDRIRQKKTAHVDEALRWIREDNDGDFPVVVKQRASAGTDGVFICADAEQVRKAFLNLVGKKDKLGNFNSEILIQEYLRGTEYVVNSVSRAGRHVITDLWEYKKKPVLRPDGGLSSMYDYDELLDFDGPVQRQLVDYALRVLEALEIRVGPAHMEIMLTERGPVLIELGARLMGGSAQAVLETAIGASALDLTLDAYLDPTKFDAVAAATHLPFNKRLHTWAVQLILPRGGYLEALPRLDELKALKKNGLRLLELKDLVHTEVAQSFDLASSPGLAILADADEKVLREGLRQIRYLEANGLYKFR